MTRTSRFVPRAVLVVTFLAAIVVSLYPVVTHKIKDARTTGVAVNYETDIAAVPTDVVDEEFAKAREYNAALDANLINDPWGESQDDYDAQYAAYLDILGSTEVMGSLEVPSVGIHQPIYHGTSEEYALSRGVGHFYGSALPVGGAGTHSVLAGHYYNGMQSLFSTLVNVEMGEYIYVNIGGQRLTYEIDQITHVLPADLSKLQPEDGKDYLTLVTCHNPYGDGPNNKYRLLVRAHNVTDELAEVSGAGEPDVTGDAGSGEAPASASWIDTLLPWMWARIAFAGAVALALGTFVVTWIIRDRKDARER